MKMLMKNVDMICVSSKDGKISPLRFRMTDGRGDTVVVKIDRILIRDEQKIAGNRMLVYKVQSLIGDIEKVYEMKYEITTCKWYIAKM
ncbi:MAG: hypothetical protein KAH14_06725 [Clostridiales bacterium]|nr:hypothetical protein [Clostridiales bacterium]